MKRSTQGGITLRTGDASDARRLLALIQANLAEGHLLPRTLDELRVHAGRVGVAIVDELRRRARRDGFEKLCAFTHAPGYFIHMGFSIVPHLWLAEKVFTDCVKCPQFRQCGQYAM